MIRAVLAVIVAVALVATVLPALGDARTRTTHEELGAMATGITSSAGELAAGSTAVADRGLAARTTLSIRLPTGFGVAPIETAGIGCPTAVLSSGGDPPPDCRAALAYRLRGEEGTVRRFPGVDVRTPEGPVRFAASPVRLQLRYVRVDGESVVQATSVDAAGTET